jgi:hypothetical protein
VSRAAALAVIAAVVALSALQWVCEGACADHAVATPTCHAKPGADGPKLRAASHSCADHDLISAVSPTGGRARIAPAPPAFAPNPAPAVRLVGIAPAIGAHDESPPLVSLRVPLRI